MIFDEVLEQVRELLRSKGRVSYRALKRRFELDDEYVEDLKAELIDAEQVARDENATVLVWTGAAPSVSAEGKVLSPEKKEQLTGRGPTALFAQDSALGTQHSVAERRQLTVMFCDLVGSTALSAQLDPEDLREVVQAYHATCAVAINRYAGYTAQHLGDGLLIYFGYPAAHEDEAARAVRAALEILAGLQLLNARLKPAIKARLPHPIQVRIGIHTGLVVIGEIGSNEKREILALGETPNLAARVQGVAESDTVAISAVTQRLVTGLFESQDLGPQTLKGFSTPVSVYRVVEESAAQSRFAAATHTGVTPMVGREEERGVLQQRWEQAKQGAGQVVLLSGDPGIGKSRLVQALKGQALDEGTACIEFHCSPYHQNSALYPIIDHLQRLLQFARDDSPAAKLEKLQYRLNRYRFSQVETFPLFASLLSLPHPEGYPPIAGSPQKQKEKTQTALIAWLVEEAGQAAVLCVWEDLHWADPSTLEVLTLLLDQVPTTRMLMLLTSRPEFSSLWGSRSYLTQLTLNRLGRNQVETIIERVTGDKTLPPEVVRQIMAKTDGVPLFVEELTKSVTESVGAIHELPLQFAIPATLQDALMARLDRLGPAKEIAQLCATLGREFSYELLHAVSPGDEGSLQQRLRQLVEAELVYQRGLPPQATYLFKHALIQDTAYQSLLKSHRQQLHQQIAQALVKRFAETVETQPELLAHHYTEAGLVEQAIPYWQRAGQRASQRSAHVEAISHLNTALRLLATLPDTLERAQQELTMQIALGLSLLTTKGFAAPEVEKAYTRARELCRHVGETPQLFPMLRGLSAFYGVRGELQTSYKLSEQFLSLAQRVQDPAHLVEAYYMLGVKLFAFGELTSAREHFEQGLAFYDLQKHRTLVSLYGHDPRMACLSFVAHTLWLLGYPEQARKRMGEALSWAQELSYPYNLAGALGHAAQLHQYLQEEQAAQERAETTITLATEQGFALVLALGKIWKGWALAEQGKGVEAVPQMCRELDALWAMGALLWRPYQLTLLAEAYEKIGQPETGLSALAEALAIVHRTGDRSYEAELYRLKGELTLQQSRASLRQVQDKSQSSQNKSEIPSTQHPTPHTQGEAEACFLKAIKVAKRQQAKSLELRATTSLAHLWQKQGKLAAAHTMLAAVYNWFTEGFDTKDLQEAKALLDELGK